ncbi:hypothetical protein AMELA_G00276280 [Ameiurus melas]|uniref:Ig-like domain-containing protein n=1 Tax=Ameiurus melas TaxID=219545 RepID=A0A7J5ZR48_AMEME|nr:hypothetical protein AMELA_G00276280 [Ameiurus melas]
MFSSTSRSAPVSEMETSRVAHRALVCVVFSGQKRISGAEVETRVRRGDDVTLYSDCVWKSGLYPVWFRNCSEKDHPRVTILTKDLLLYTFPHYLFVFNNFTNVHNLLIKNVTESDQGVYYCAVRENVISKNNDDITITTEVYHYGNRSTRLSVLETEAELTGSDKRTTWGHDEVEVEVCYASLDIQNLKKKKKKKRRVQNSDFSTYSEVRTDRSSGDVSEF